MGSRVLSLVGLLLVTLPLLIYLQVNQEIVADPCFPGLWPGDLEDSPLGPEYAAQAVNPTDQDAGAAKTTSNGAAGTSQ